MYGHTLVGVRYMEIKIWISYFKNVSLTVSRTQQGRVGKVSKRESSVKTLRSTFSTEFFEALHVEWQNLTQALALAWVLGLGAKAMKLNSNT